MSEPQPDDFAPRILIDTREQDPLPITRYPSARGTLSTCDYSFAGGEHLFTVERKSIPDLVRSLILELDHLPSGGHHADCNLILSFPPPEQHFLQDPSIKPGKPGPKYCFPWTSRFFHPRPISSHFARACNLPPT